MFRGFGNENPSLLSLVRSSGSDLNGDDVDDDDDGAGGMVGIIAAKR